MSESRATREMSFGRTRRARRRSNFWIAAWWNSIEYAIPRATSPGINVHRTTYVYVNFVATRTEDTQPDSSIGTADCEVTSVVSGYIHRATTYARGYAREALTHARMCTRRTHNTYMYVWYACFLGVYCSQVYRAGIRCSCSWRVPPRDACSAG